MGSDPVFLCFDTSAAHCAVAVFAGDSLRADATVEMARGQAEALVPLLQRVMAEASCDTGDLTALGVGIGPGNFTGTRIAVATARGMSLALGRPAIGVSSFDLMRDAGGQGVAAAEIVSVPAPRDMAYVQHYQNGTVRSAPFVIDPANPPEDLCRPIKTQITGYRAEEIAGAFGADWRPESTEALVWRLGRVTASKWRSGAIDLGRPAPLYVRKADAAPPADPPPRLLA